MKVTAPPLRPRTDGGNRVSWFWEDRVQVCAGVVARMDPSDVLWSLLIVAAFLAGAVPWALGGEPSDTLVWGFAVAPPLVLALLLGIRERRRAVASTGRK